MHARRLPPTLRKIARTAMLPWIGLCLLLGARPAFGMHIMEGFLPPAWSIAWSAAALPFVAASVITLKKRLADNPKGKLLMALAAAFIFVLSALRIPSVTGSSSHPTGIALGAILFGPLAVSALGLGVLLFQALLLAHGGLTTLGANTFAMAVVGPYAAYAAHRLISRLKGPPTLAVMGAALAGNLGTYATTAMQLALAFPSANGGVSASFAKFLAIFALTQVPLSISEGIVTALTLNGLASAGIVPRGARPLPAAEGTP